MRLILKSKYKKRWKGADGKWRYSYYEKKGKQGRAYSSYTSGKVKSLANERDVAHSLAMIKGMYGRRGAGQGMSLPIASTEDFDVIINKTTFVMLSAGRNPEKPEDVALSDEQITKRTASLRTDLVQSGYVFTDCNGKYGLPEESIMAMVHDADVEHIASLGSKYNQDSVVVCDKGKNKLIFTTGPKKGTSDMEGDGYEFREITEDDDYYTDVEIGGKTKRFSLFLEEIKKALWKMGNAIQELRRRIHG